MSQGKSILDVFVFQIRSPKCWTPIDHERRLFGAYQLPIRSIDFYYPEFQAANVRIFRDKSTMCFLEPTWSNLCRNFLNFLDNVISPISISPIISKGVLHVGRGLKCGNFGSQIGIGMR